MLVGLVIYLLFFTLQLAKDLNAVYLRYPALDRQNLRVLFGVLFFVLFLSPAQCRWNIATSDIATSHVELTELLGIALDLDLESDYPDTFL